jgi:hypothetical protein
MSLQLRLPNLFDGYAVLILPWRGTTINLKMITAVDISFRVLLYTGVARLVTSEYIERTQE